MKILTYISRILTGSLFIVSGLIKANDPFGFSYKLGDYFAPDVLNMGFLEPFALELAILICIAEIVLGVAVLFGAMMRTVSWSLLLMIVFFTFLTFYSAYFNKVTDCGCFGDALKLTPWESFTKDIVLLFFIGIIFFKRKAITINTNREDVYILPAALALIGIFSLGVISWGFPVLFSLLVFAALILIKRFVPSGKQNGMMAGTALLFTILFSVYCIRHLPVKDFRPYAIGKSIPEGMTIPEGEEPPQYAVIYTLKHSQTGEEQKINSNAYVASGIWEDESWEIIDTSEPVLIKKGYEPPIHDFSLFSPDGSDYTEDILTEPYVFLLISYDITGANKKVQFKINKFAADVNDSGYLFIGVTASSYDDLEDFRHSNQNMFDYYTGDQIVLKTIIRSNPGLVLLKEGRVIGKWHYNDFPEFQGVKDKYLK